MDEKTLSRALLDFIAASPSCYHAVAAAARELEAGGYLRLEEQDSWDIRPGGRYFVVRGGSSLAAFRLPQGEPKGYMIAAGHSDSPSFKLRESAEAQAAGGCLRLSAEPYGGGIYSTWMDRPLSVAGRITVRSGGRMSTRLVDIDRDLLVIPSVAIHMNRKVNEGAPLDPNNDLLPLCGEAGDKGRFKALVARAAGAEEKDILASELFLYPRTPGTLVGLEEEFILSPRLDDLQCVFACLRGFLEARESASVPVLCIFNNEEVGSGTRQGADSTFLEDVLSRVSEARGLSPAGHKAALAGSFMVSADNAHAVHPNRPEYADRNERPVLNGGVVIKYNANQRYTTDAVSAAVFRAVCEDAGAAVQSYSNRADLPGGSTLGNISSSHVSVPTVDVGLPQLAMHSCCELAGVRDTACLARAMAEFFSRSFRRTGDGEFCV